MVIRIAHSHIEPARLEREEVRQEITRLVEEAIIPALRQLPGFLDYKGGVNRETGHLVSLTTWESAEHAGGANDAIRKVVSGRPPLEGLVLEPPENYEIVTLS